MKEIISKQEAAEKGLKRYYTGKPCKHGHVSEFFVKGSCCTCALLRMQNKRKNSEFRVAENKREMEKRKSNPEYHKKRNQNSKNWWNKNKDNPAFVEMTKKKNKEWSASETGRQWTRNYIQQKLKTDQTWLVASRVRSRIKEAFRKNGYTKKSSTFEIVGCSFDELKVHIERQFLKGMTWENKEKWHIDHIVPLASAKNQDDVFKLNHFTNLRPMWAKDNLSKNAKILHLL